MPGSSPPLSRHPAPARRVLPTATQAPPACNSIGWGLLEGGLGSFHSADICCLPASPSQSSCSGESSWSRSMLEELPRCRRRASPQGVHRARWVGPARIWGLASKMEEISRRPCLLKDRTTSRLHHCEFCLQRKSHTVWRSSQEGGLEEAARGAGRDAVTFGELCPLGCRADTQNA